MRLTVKGELSHRRCAPGDALALPANEPIIESAMVDTAKASDIVPNRDDDGRLSKCLESLDLKALAE